jgi:hypothetical protein
VRPAVASAVDDGDGAAARAEPAAPGGAPRAVAILAIHVTLENFRRTWDKRECKVAILYNL